nr:cd151 antigen [Hymenolepis microstoma]
MGETVYINIYLFISLGILLVLVCILGFVAISKNNPPILRLYAIVLAIAFILHLCVAAVALLYYHFAMNWNAETLFNKMKNEYHLQDNDVTHAVDELQKQYKCCGSWSYHDWQWSGFENNSKLETSENSKKPSIVPNSCCIGLYPECGKIIHPSNIYYKGCISKITEELNSTLFIICVLLFGLAIVELIGVILACCYWKAPKHAYN